MSVWDPVVEHKEKNTGPQAVDTPWVSEGYEVPTDEVIEIIRLEFIPAVSGAGEIRDALIELLIDGKAYDTIHINSYMNPALHMLNAGVACDFGVPYLHRPITGILPSPIDATCPKAKEGHLVQVRVTALEAVASGESYQVGLRFARVRTEAKLREVVGVASIPVSFSLDKDMYARPAVPVTIGNWDVLPGGLAQPKPIIMPWFTFASNRVATTPNRWYHFDYPAYVDETWKDLAWNLVNKPEAYYVKHLGVTPHANSLRTRLFIEGRITNPEFLTRPLPEQNFFWPASFKSVETNERLKRAGLTKIVHPFLFHGVKGGIEHIDNGTAIPADGVRIDVVGTHFTLR